MKRIQLFIRRIPFTLILLTSLTLVALVTNTHFQEISQHWLNRIGFAPNDLWYWRLERILTSALVTQGGIVFWEALLMTAFATGTAEWMTGWKRTAVTFWGIHILSLVLLSIIVLIGYQQLQSIGLESSELVRDVGPSAGYFGCLGLVSARLHRPWHWITGGILILLFTLTLFLPPGSGEDAKIKFSADLAHLLAFPLGWLSGFIWPPRIQQSTLLEKS